MSAFDWPAEIPGPYGRAYAIDKQDAMHRLTHGGHAQILKACRSGAVRMYLDARSRLDLSVAMGRCLEYVRR